jgi:phospholipid/cholesterol/gamma-HCH transport system substrate-binding protein
MQWAQLRVGIMVIISLIVFAVAVFFISGQAGFFTRHYTLKAYLSSAGELREGAQVRLAGIAVGNVSKIGISPYDDRKRAVQVDLKIARTFQKRIRADSLASVETVGLLGDSYVDITRGTSGEELEDGGEVKTARSKRLKRLILPQ